MFKDIRTYMIAGLSFALIIFVLRDCSRPSEEKEADRKKQYETEVAILKAEKAEISSRQEATVKRYSEKVKQDSINLRAQDARIQSLKSKLANQRPKVIEKIQADSAVLSYVNTLEETVNELQVQVDTLKAQNEFQRKLNEDLIAQEYIEDRIEADMAIQNTRRISELEKAAKKKQRGSKLWKTVSTILAGAVIFETVILVAD